MTNREILEQPTLSLKDIMQLTNTKRTRASQIMSKCRALYNGTVPMNKKLIKTSSYIRYLGYTPEEYRDYVSIHNV